MCTLLLLRRRVEGYPLLLLMNRDELYGRPSQGPVLSKNGPSVIAPEDRQAGGTWVGVNDMGLVVAISNRHEGEFDTTRRSRGLLCRDALRRSSTLEVKDFLEEELEEVVYNPFNLLYADQGRAFVTYHGEASETVELEGQTHVLANLDVDDPTSPRVQRTRDLLATVAYPDLETALTALQRIAADHEEVEGQSICLHGEKVGTVSSTIIALAEAFPAQSHFLYRAGRPCEGPYEDYSGLHEELLG